MLDELLTFQMTLEYFKIASINLFLGLTKLILKQVQNDVLFYASKIIQHFYVFYKNCTQTKELMHLRNSTSMKQDFHFHGQL